MNLAYRYPIMFWNCACLISDAGGDQDEDVKEEDVFAEEIEYEDNIENFDDDDDDDDEDEEEEVEEKKKVKKKVKSVNYGKIASAIGKISATGVIVTGPDVNESSYTFSPDIIHNTIRYGLSGITRVGDDVIQAIIDNRPYTGIEDFLKKVKVKKPQMINLIKAGAFDSFGDRVKLMHQYVNLISDTKKRITLQNMKMLIDFGLIPDEYDMERRVYNFNKYIKKMKLDATYYGLDNIAFNFYTANFDVDLLIPAEETESTFKIKQTDWDKIYQKHMDKVRPYVQKHNAELLDAVNTKLTKDVWDKYCLGSLSKWEMDSMSCYSHKHELAAVPYSKYGFDEFFDLPEQPEIERFLPIKGKTVPIYQLHRIVGTVLDRDKNKKNVTLLTQQGVVTVRIYGNVFAQYDKQLSQRGADGKKHVLERSWFSRGNKIIVTGIRQGDNEFLAKKYSRTPYHLVELITAINEDGTIETRTERLGEDEE